MQLYETIFIARQEMSPAQVETLAQTLIGVLKENQAAVGKTEYCGLRTLAYPIKKNKKGHYVLLNVNASAEALKEFERRMRLNEDILRYMSVLLEEHEEGPSALLKATRYGREDGEQPSRRYQDNDREGGRPSRTPSGRAARPSSESMDAVAE